MEKTYIEITYGELEKLIGIKAKYKLLIESLKTKDDYSPVKEIKEIFCNESEN